MTRQTSESKKQASEANITVLFGTDEHGKPRAAWFEAANPELITKAAAAPNALIVHPSVTAKTVQELVAAIKADPAKVNAAPEGQGWFFRMKLADQAQLGKLMTKDQYTEFTKGL